MALPQGLRRRRRAPRRRAAGGHDIEAVHFDVRKILEMPEAWSGFLVWFFGCRGGILDLNELGSVGFDTQNSGVPRSEAVPHPSCEFGAETKIRPLGCLDKTSGVWTRVALRLRIC